LKGLIENSELMRAKCRTGFCQGYLTVLRSRIRRAAKPLLGNRNRSPGLCALAAVAFWVAWACSPANCAEIWFSGRADMPDYLQLFESSAPWARAAMNIRVFKVSTQFLGGASDENLIHVFSDLKRRHISLAWAALMLTATRECGNGIEGYADTNTIKTIVERIRRLGGDLRYVAMDEPLWFGHFSTLPHACHTSTGDLAREIAGKVVTIRRSFPDAQIGDTEGIGTLIPPHWVDELTHWADAYRAAVGEPLAFIHLDVLWDGPWPDQVKQLIPRLRERGIKFGIIYNGNPDDQTSLAWTQHAEDRFVTVERNESLIPDQAILQTWFPYPTHMLPETQPGTMTWLVNRYLAVETRLDLHRAGDRVEGQLTDTAGHPLTGAPVTLSAEFTGQGGVPALHVRSGRVPPKAVAALLALRINTECNCSGIADIEIGLAQYHDDLTGQTVQRAFRPPPSVPADSATLAHFEARPEQAIMQNTASFPVAVGDPFTIQVPMRTDLASTSSGYVALIFLDEQGKGVERLHLPFEPAERPIGTATTDAQGRFSFVPNPAVLRQASGFRIKFSGTSQYRMAEAGVR